MIYYFQPGNKEKILGKAYNDHCRIVPNEEDWVVLTDIDIMILTPEFYQLLDDVIKQNPEVDFFTSYTNRTKNKKQLYRGIYDERNLSKLRDWAVKVKGEHGSSVSLITGDMSGHFMMFRKKLWVEVGGFSEVECFKNRGTIVGIDTDFSRKLKNKECRIIQGLLAIHYYRMNEGENYRGHLS